MILFDGDDVAVVCTPTASETVVVTFTVLEDESVPWGRQFSAKQGQANLHIFAKRKHWYQTPEMIPATAAAHDFVRDFDRAIGYSASMGGYGALQWSNEIGLTQILAISPQITLRPGARLNPAWNCPARLYRDDIPETLRLRPQIIFDPLDLYDSWQMAQLDDFDALIAPCGGHAPLGVMKDGGRIRRVIASALDGGLCRSTFRNEYRRARRHSATYWLNLHARRPETAGLAKKRWDRWSRQQRLEHDRF